MSDTRVELRRNDGSEVFKLKSTRVQTEVSNGLITDSIISGVSRRVLGGKLVLDLRTFTIDFDIQGMESEDYPNSDTPEYQSKGHDFGFRWEVERASLEWGWTTTAGFDELHYDGRTLNGVVTNLSVTEDTESGKARTYTGTIQFTYLDRYIS